METDNTEYAKVSVHSYLCIIVLFIINLLNYMDRYTIAAVLTQVQESFDINDAEGGLLQTVFIISFMIFAPVCGFLGDRYNRKWIMIVGIAVWVLAVFASSFVPENLFWLFVLLRGVVGIGEASYIVIAPTIIADTFVSVVRSRVLMFFYFAIPVGSGVGYMVGSYMSSLLNTWRWGIRVTPFFGIVCLLLIIVVIREPQRGEAEKAIGAEKAFDIKPTSYWEDVKAICRIPTFLFATLGYTTVVFVVGTLGWWGPAAIQHAKASEKGLNDTNNLDSSEKDSISFIFGAVTLAGGVLGVFAGGLIAQMWYQGKWCFAPIKSPRGNALVCAIGCVMGVPFLFAGFHLITTSVQAAWICVFLAITGLCLNWATNADMLLDVVTPRRRSAANAWQTSFSHLFGDASGPYIVGLVSDLIRGHDDTPRAHFDSLVNAFYVPTVILILGAVFFFISAAFFVRDNLIFQEQMGFSTSKSTYNKDDMAFKDPEKGNGLVNEAYADSRM